MDPLERDVVPVLSTTSTLHADERKDTYSQRFRYMTRSASMSIPESSSDYGANENDLVGLASPLRSKRKTSYIQMSGPLYSNVRQENPLRLTLGAADIKMTKSLEEIHLSLNGMDQNGWADSNSAGKNENLLQFGQLGMCNDPYCTTCTTIYSSKGEQKTSKPPLTLDPKFPSVLNGDDKGLARRICSFLRQYIPGIMSPHSKVVQKWNKFCVVSSLVAIFLDPFFFFLLSVQQDRKCIVLDWTFTTVMVVLRSVTDFIYLLHILLQFRLAYVAPESRIVGGGDLIDHPKTIAFNYLSGLFVLDFFVMIPLPQIITLLFLPQSIESSGVNYAKNLLRAAILVQYIPRLYRFLLLVGRSPSGFIYESASGNFVLNLLIFVLYGHVVGSCWYLFGLQRVYQCLRLACADSRIDNCTKFIDCGHGTDPDRFTSYPTWDSWKNSDKASSCFGQDVFNYGIYVQAVYLTAERSIITRYVYSLFWGFQQINTLAGSQAPNQLFLEVIFTMVGLLLSGLLIGNLLNFRQDLGTRSLDMSIRRRDIEQWMSHQRLPVNLRRNVREAERYNWAATRGVNEELILESLPEDLQIEIRRHLFKFVKKVRIFALMDEPVLDAIYEKLRQKTYIKGSKPLYLGGLVSMMVFIVRGKMESIGEDGNRVPLSEGDACGEELLTWCLEHSFVNEDSRKHRLPGPRLLSRRMVECLSNVEAFVLRAADLEEVASLFTRFLRNPSVQSAIRYESLYWRGLAANCIQVAWRYRKKRLSRGDTNSP